MSSGISIANHKKFIQHNYAFRINLQCFKNLHNQGDFRQAQSDAIINFTHILEIANREASGSGHLKNEFESWLLRNYDLNREHCIVLMNEDLDFGAKCIDGLMIDIRKKKEDNQSRFHAALTEYEHVKGTLTKRTVRQNQAQYVAAHFGSILRKISAFDTLHMYEMHRDRLQEDFNYIVQRMQELKFVQLASRLETEWHIFEENGKAAKQSLEMQNKEIQAALKLCMLDEKRTFLEQIAQKIGEIYESIRDKLRNIRNNAFALKQAFLNPIISPVESLKNIVHVFCHPQQTAKVAWEWMKENPGKTAMLIIGSVGISVVIGTVVGVVGTALYTSTSILSLTSADIVAAGIVSSTVLTSTGLVAAGGKAARESALTAKKAIDDELSQRNRSLDQLTCEEEKYRKRAREEMRTQRTQDEMQRRETSLVVLNSETSDTGGEQHEASAMVNDFDRLADAAQEMQFAKEDLASELVATYQEERVINDHLEKIIRQSQQVKEAIKQKQNERIKKAAKDLVTILNDQDRFDAAARILDALKRQDYNQLASLVDQFSFKKDSIENDENEQSASGTDDDLE